MSSITASLSPAQVFVVRLQASDPLRPGAVAGRLEHVLSGRRHDFDNADALAACLLHERTQIEQRAGAAAPDPDVFGTAR